MPQGKSAVVIEDDSFLTPKLQQELSENVFGA
jgi:hypothetical protein